MIYIEAPTKYYTGDLTIFLAGGITNCPDWQKEIVEYFKDTKIVIYNPRREDFPIDDPTAAKAQIEWEFEFLDHADLILFWFSKGSLNPIVLFEYGKWLMNLRNDENYKPIFVGIDPEYKRKQDVWIQTVCENGYIANRIVYSVKELAEQIKREVKQND